MDDCSDILFKVCRAVDSKYGMYGMGEPVDVWNEYQRLLGEGAKPNEATVELSIIRKAGWMMKDFFTGYRLRCEVVE